MCVYRSIILEVQKYSMTTCVVLHTNTGIYIQLFRYVDPPTFWMYVLNHTFTQLVGLGMYIHVYPEMIYYVLEWFIVPIDPVLHTQYRCLYPISILPTFVNQSPT